jgi:hypothetical protein
MRRVFQSRTTVVAVLGAVAVVVVVVAVIVATSGGSTSGSASTVLSPVDSVLNPGYAKSIGFPKTLQAAKKTTVSAQKGCTDSVEAVYEDALGKTGLISDVLNCASPASASTALASARKQVEVDRSLKVPKGLGSSAFATSSNAPEYLMVWQAGSRVAITALDVDVAASSSTSTSSTVAPHPLTQAQEQTLGDAALQQNSLYHS